MTRPRKPRVGRPPLPPGTARTVRVHISLTESERNAIETLAASHGVHVAEWIRRRATTTGAAE